uniref:Kinase binding protein CGI-121 n=1 Tax=Amblyomma maculatum TaxID=34609 RepID=G3MMJ2_AMBMU
MYVFIIILVWITTLLLGLLVSRVPMCQSPSYRRDEGALFLWFTKKKACCPMEYVMHNREGNRAATILLYDNVTNCSDLRQMVLNSGLQVCLIRASLVADVFQVQCALAKALANHSNGRMKTRSLLSEILYILGPTGSIGDSLRQMGAQDSDTTLVLVCMNDPEDRHLNSLKEHIKGSQLPLDSIPQFTDCKALAKLFKVTEKELSVGSLLDAVVTRIALKDMV